MDNRSVERLADRLAAILAIVTFVFILCHLNMPFVSPRPAHQPPSELAFQAAIELRIAPDPTKPPTERRTRPSGVESSFVPPPGANPIELLEPNFVTGTSKSVGKPIQSK